MGITCIKPLPPKNEPTIFCDINQDSFSTCRRPRGGDRCDKEEAARVAQSDIEASFRAGRGSGEAVLTVGEDVLSVWAPERAHLLERISIGVERVGWYVDW